MGFIIELIMGLLDCGAAGGIAIAFLLCGAYIVVCAVCGGLMSLVAVLIMLFDDIARAISLILKKGEAK